MKINDFFHFIKFFDAELSEDIQLLWGVKQINKPSVIITKMALQIQYLLQPLYCLGSHGVLLVVLRVTVIVNLG